MNPSHRLAVIYLLNTNGLLSSTHVFSHVTQSFGGNTTIGDDNGTANRAFDGTIDEVVVFNRSLSQAEIVNRYAASGGAGFLPVTMAIERSGSNLQLSWPQGTLLEADEVEGPWRTNNASSPYLVTPSATKKFYRIIVR